MSTPRRWRSESPQAERGGREIHAAYKQELIAVTDVSWTLCRHERTFEEYRGCSGDCLPPLNCRRSSALSSANRANLLCWSQYFRGASIRPGCQRHCPYNRLLQWHWWSLRALKLFWGYISWDSKARYDNRSHTGIIGREIQPSCLQGSCGVITKLPYN